MSDEKVGELFMPILQQHGINVPMEKVVVAAGLMKSRVNFGEELYDLCKFFFIAPTAYEEKTRKKRWKEDSGEMMTKLADLLEGLDDFSLEHQEEVVMKWIEENGYHTGNIMNAFRLTLVGDGIGPHMFDISAFLGKEETLARMRRAVASDCLPVFTKTTK
jgi:glutamyl-tRNA synthetase